jgi:hypothetical protein
MQARMPALREKPMLVMDSMLLSSGTSGASAFLAAPVQCSDGQSREEQVVAQSTRQQVVGVVVVGGKVAQVVAGGACGCALAEAGGVGGARSKKHARAATM